MYLCKSSFTMYNIREGYDVYYFPNYVKNVRVQALSDSVKFSRLLMQNIFDLLSCDLTTSKDQSYTEQSLHDRNKIVMRGRSEICAHLCHYVNVYISPITLIFENFRGRGEAYARYAFPWIRAWATNRETWLLIANNDVSKTNISGASGSDCVYSLDLNIMYMTALWLILMRLLYLHVLIDLCFTL